MKLTSCCRGELIGRSVLALAVAGSFCARANPTGGTVVQGAASFNSSGAQLTIHTSDRAFLNWQSFNIGAGETTTFVQPSSRSVVWNHINGPDPSQILGTLNANGYVILQNPAGFYVGGQAAVSTRGLVMTTASTPRLNLFSGGAWEFDAPPPTATIVNYGRITVAGGAPAFLIANNIANHGVISAPGGTIGLYAGETVLLSTSPDGRGLSAEVTLPQGSVDNDGRLIADAGSIALRAQVVNQDGLVQANSAREVNGAIELLAGDSVNLGAHSVISARGDARGTSAGGSVTIKAGNSFSDQLGSVIDISGGAQGGNGGRAEISAPQMGAINSSVNGQAASGFVAGVLTIDPLNVLLTSYSTDPNAQYSGTVNPNDPPLSGTLTLNVNSFAGTLSQIDIQALNNIELGTLWTLADASAPSTLTLAAGNNIILDDGSGIQAGNNWSLKMTAGTAFSGTAPASGNDGIYLNGSAYLQTKNGDISLVAPNEVIVNSGAIRTIGGGNIDVTAQYGDVNTGTSASGFNYLSTAPYYTPFNVIGYGLTRHPDYNHSSLGGISTAAGGNVTINAGGDVTSFPTTAAVTALGGYPDPGTGAFGPEPGNVTIKAGGSIYGNYVVMNGAGKLTAGQNIGTSVENQNVALSLAKGSWSLNAQADIYLQEVRNPNGVFNNTTVGTGQPSAGNHLFDYDPQASVALTAGNAVYLTGYNLPRPNGAVPLLLPPILDINAGAGGVILQTPNAADNTVSLSDYDITLFPSPDQQLQIATTAGGGLSSGNANGANATLLMSDSAQTRWFIPSANAPAPFGETDHATVPPGLNNNNPVNLQIAGNMDDIILRVSKLAQIAVGGDMIGCSFYGVNLHANDVTSIAVKGRIYNAGSFNSVTLDQPLPSVPATDLPPGAINPWYSVLEQAVDPSKLPAQSLLGDTPSQLAQLVTNARQYPGIDPASQLVYDPATKKLTAVGPLSLNLLIALEQPSFTVVRYGPNGYPLLDSNGHFVMDTITWPGANDSQITSLYQASQGAPPLLVANGAYWLGGGGQFDISAASISLGNSLGIISLGAGKLKGVDYSFLAPYVKSGAAVNVSVAGDLNTPSSTIATLAGGDVTVNAGGSMDLGSQDLVDFEGQIMDASHIALGIYSTDGGNVNVLANGTINIDSSRIATFNGGDVSIQSLTGDVNAGSGGSIAVPINVFAPGVTFNGPVEQVYVNGIAAETLANPSLVPGSATVPGNITVSTPQGSIYASLGGIKQEALNGTAPAGPTITLEAGTPGAGGWGASGTPAYVGDIELGTVGVIGETVDAKATGKITGLVISRHDASVSSQSVGSLTVLAGGTATVSAHNSGAGSGITVIGGQGVSASGVGSGATLLGQNVSVNGATAQSTLGTSASATAASQSAAGQTSTENQQQVASNDTSDEKKKKKKKPALVRSVGRVTVILPKAS